MIFVVNSENRRHFAADLLDMHRQRKTRFVDGLGWKIPVVADLEIDRYDGEDTVYLLGKAMPGGELLASTRLLPTVQPHLMDDLFPDANRFVLPRGPGIWEISRFCPAPWLGRRARVQLLWEIICGVMETAVVFGVDRVVFAANSELLPLTLSCGWQAKAVASTIHDGHEVTAVAVSITLEGLRSVRQRFNVSAPAIRFYAWQESHDGWNAGERLPEVSEFDPAWSHGSTSDLRFRPGDPGVARNG